MSVAFAYISCLLTVLYLNTWGVVLLGALSRASKTLSLGAESIVLLESGVTTAMWKHCQCILQMFNFCFVSWRHHLFYVSFRSCYNNISF